MATMSDSVIGRQALNGTSVPLIPTPSTTGLNFPMKLHCCLSELEREGLSHIAGFQPHGRCIVVRKQHEFVAEILPRWFNHSKYSSFQRQLNLYGFQRIASGPDKHGYHHPNFLRGQLDRASQIPREGIKGYGPRKPDSNQIVPNFYAMSFLTGDEPLTSDNHGEPPEPNVASLSALVPPSTFPRRLGSEQLQVVNASTLSHSVPAAMVSTELRVPGAAAAPHQFNLLADALAVQDMLQRQRDQQRLCALQQLVEQQRQRELQLLASSIVPSHLALNMTQVGLQSALNNRHRLLNGLSAVQPPSPPALHWREQSNSTQEAQLLRATLLDAIRRGEM